jgi:hypothetical protein
MARPRRQVDYEEIHRLQDLGWGSRRIARQVGASRSLVQRELAGRRSSSSARRPGPGPRSRRSEADRHHAHELLRIGRGRETDAEFDAARRRLDELLDAMPDSSASSVYYDVRRELDAALRRREDWLRDAGRDLTSRWEFEARLAARKLSQLDYSERRPIERALDEEKERALTLLARRMKEMAAGTSTGRLVDRLVAKGLARLDHVLKDVR